MPLYFETQHADGGVNRIPLDQETVVVVAEAGARYRVVSADGETIEADGLRVTRTAQDLYVRGLPGEHVITIEDFFLVCRFEAACQLQLDTLGEPDEAITPLSAAFATGEDGLLLWAAADEDDDGDEDDDDDDDEWSSFDLLLTGGLGVAAVGALGAGTGSGDNTTRVADDGSEQALEAADDAAGDSEQSDSDDDSADGDTNADSAGTDTGDTASTGDGDVAGEDATDDGGDAAGEGSDSSGSDGSGDEEAGNEGTGSEESGDEGETGTDGSNTVDPQDPADVIVSVDNVLDNEPAGTGWFGPDVAVNDLTPVISGSVTNLPGDAAVQLLRDGELLGLTAVDNNQWAFVDTLPGDGSYSYEAIVTDAAGATIAGSTGYELRIDTVAPATPALDPVAGDNIVMPGEATEGVILAGTAEAGARVSVSWAGAEQSVLADDAGGWSLTIQTAPAGITVLQLVAEDSAQNRSDTLTRVVQVIAPDASLGDTTSGAGDIAGALSADWLTGLNQPVA